MKRKPTIVERHKENFETLCRAIKAGDVALMDCIEKETGEHVAVLCAVEHMDEEYVFIPFVRFFNGNPYELLLNPNDPEYEKATK